MGVTISMLSLGCGKNEAPAPPPPPIVNVALPIQRDIPVLVEIIGITEAVSNVQVRARVEGLIEEIRFKEGAEVMKGAPLFAIDKEPIRQRIAAASAQVGELEANLVKLDQEVERLQPLAGTGAISQRMLDNAIQEQKQGKATLEAGRANLKSAEFDLEYADVSAPVSGLIGAKEVDIGSLVGRGEPTLLATISPLDPISVNVEVSEVTYLDIAESLRSAESNPVFGLVLANGEVHKHLGKLDFVDRMVDSSTGTLRFRIKFPNPEKILRPGQFCRLRVLSEVIKGAILVPQRAIREIQGISSVFVVDGSGTASFRKIETGMRIGTLRHVTGGLESGERIIVDGIVKAGDGLKVNPTEVKVDESTLATVINKVPGGFDGTPAEKRPLPGGQDGQDGQGGPKNPEGKTGE